MTIQSLLINYMTLDAAPTDLAAAERVQNSPCQTEEKTGI
jgi:hypothetical protein